MPNVASIIKSHNKKVSSKEEGQQGNASKLYNGWKNNPCPMQGKCLTSSVIYKAEVKAADEDNSKLYIGLAELPFKSRYYVHQSHSGTRNISTAQNYPGTFGNSSRRRRNPSSHSLSPGRHALTTMEPKVATYSSPRNYS